MLRIVDQFLEKRLSLIIAAMVVFIVVCSLGSIVKASPCFPEPTQIDANGNKWRLTNHGWEQAQTIESSLRVPTVEFSLRNEFVVPVSTWVRIHRCLLPIAIATLFATLVPYLLLQLPNRAID